MRETRIAGMCIFHMYIMRNSKNQAIEASSVPTSVQQECSNTTDDKPSRLETGMIAVNQTGRCRDVQCAKVEQHGTGHRRVPIISTGPRSIKSALTDLSDIPYRCHEQAPTKNPVPSVRCPSRNPIRKAPSFKLICHLHLPPNRIHQNKTSNPD